MRNTAKNITESNTIHCGDDNYGMISFGKFPGV